MGLFPKDRNLATSPEEVELEVRASDFRIRPDEVSIRLDAFLHHHLTWRSRTSVQKLVRDGFVSVRVLTPDRPTGETVLEKRPGRILRHGAVVVVRIPAELRLPSITANGGQLVVLFEDEDVLAVDKPPLLSVHPAGRHLTDTLIQRIHAHYAPPDDDGGKPARIPIRLCHRLDRETSGIVLCGKNAAGHRLLMKQFEARKIEKEYLAVVHGEPDEDEGYVDAPLGQARASRVHLKMAVRVDGMDCATSWRVLERHGAHSLLACRPLTGRQHQIRVHLAYLGHPIVGDKLYGPDEDYFLRAARGELPPGDMGALELPRQALHNHRIAFRSPSTGERVEVVSPLAPDLRSFLDR